MTYYEAGSTSQERKQLVLEKHSKITDIEYRRKSTE
jgi:hypothetical protein